MLAWLGRALEAGVDRAGELVAWCVRRERDARERRRKHLKDPWLIGIFAAYVPFIAFDSLSFDRTIAVSVVFMLLFTGRSAWLARRDR